jgi:hypothetical protein
VKADFLERFADKVEMHKFIDDIPDGEAVLVLSDTGSGFRSKSLGDPDIATVLFMCRSFEHWVLTKSFEP